MFVDSHAHLNHPKFAYDWRKVLEKAKEVEIAAVINIGYDIPSSEMAVKQCNEVEGENLPKLFASIAIHPHNAKDWGAKVARRIHQLAKHPFVAAIGETGLDFHYDFSPKECQIHAFEEQLELAYELGLPLVLHIREAHSEAINVIRNFGKTVIGVAHCFTGTWDEAKKWLELGFYIGIAGIVTFESKAENVKEVAEKVPIDKLLIETDAPYLAPVPYRGKRNEPAYLVRVASAIAELKGVSITKIADATTQNAIKLFRIEIP